MNKKLSFMALSLTALLSLGACSDDKPKTTGEKVDEAISKTKDVAKDLGEKAKDVGVQAKEAAIDATEKAKEIAADAGDVIEDACEKAKEKLDVADPDC